MNDKVGEVRSGAPQSASTGKDKNGAPGPGEMEAGNRAPAEAGDITPTQSRHSSPFGADKPTLKSMVLNEDNISTSITNSTEATIVSRTSVDRLEDHLHTHSYRETEHASTGTSIVYDSHSPSSCSASSPDRPLTSKYRSGAPPAPDGTLKNDMSDSTPSPNRSSGPTRSGHPGRQQQQQRSLQPYGYYMNPSAPDAGFPGNLPSASSQSVHSSLMHAQRPATMQHPSSFAGQYAMSSPTASIYPQHHVQHQYSFPSLSIPGMAPTLAHAHSHSQPDFYPVAHSASPTQPPLYAPSFHTNAPPEHTPSPTRAYDYDGAGSTGRNPSAVAGPSYTSQQPFASFGFHATLTGTPQFTHSHSTFSPAFSPPQTHGPQYPQSYTYMARGSPASSEDVRQQPSTTWWYIPPPSASPSAGPYPSVYYIDAYNNPSNSGPGQGRAFSSFPPSSSPRTAHSPAFSLPDPAASTGSRSGTGTPGGGLQHSGEEPIVPDSTTSSRNPQSLLPITIDASAKERIPRQQQQQEVQLKQSTRRSNLPNPPVQRSEWVMWVGNVPNDATHDELWRFFIRSITESTAPPAEAHTAHHYSLQQMEQMSSLSASVLAPSGGSSASDATPSGSSGVQSVFLIARSNCAFVNYASLAHLAAAVQRFNGVPLRPGDPRCPRLVCRIRGKEEDRRAGVGAQRGTGVHTRWVREQQERGKVREREQKRTRGKEAALTDVETSASDPPGTPLSTALTESGTESSSRAPHHSSSSGSTTSGFLSRYFPKRYFILKSLSQHDLDLSVEKGVWATQPHNEAVLNQAFRSSSDVFLIFSVNKSGEFFGYARMASPIGKAADRVSWASRAESQRSQHSHSPAASLVSSIAGKGSQVGETIPEENEGNALEGREGDSPKAKEKEQGSEAGQHPLMLFSPSEHRLAEDSPQPVTPAIQKRLTSAEETDSGSVRRSTRRDMTTVGRRYEEYTDLPRTSESWSSAPPPLDRSAPAVMGGPYHKLTHPKIQGLGSETINPSLLRRHPSDVPDIQLDPTAPARATREQQSRRSGEERSTEVDPLRRKEIVDKPTSDPRIDKSVREVPRTEQIPLPSGRDLQPETAEADEDSQANDISQAPADDEPTDASTPWGLPFRVQWIHVKKLPFSRTRHLRNPWNHEREVKVSRDGTELEPIVGQALLDEWDKEDSSTPPPPASITGGGGAGAPSSSSAGRRSVHPRRVQISTSSERGLASGSGAPQAHQQKHRSQ